MRRSRLPAGAISSSRSVRARHAYAMVPSTATPNCRPPHFRNSHPMCRIGVSPVAREVVVVCSAFR